jgi:hypothetical protein
MIKKIGILVTLLPLMLLVGCATSYKEAPKDSPHATIEVKPSGNSLADSMFVRKASIYSINGLPIDTTWKGDGKLRRIPTGLVEILAVANISDYETASALLVLEAKQGIDYILDYADTDPEDSIVELFIFEKESGNTVTSSEAEKKEKREILLFL